MASENAAREEVGALGAPRAMLTSFLLWVGLRFAGEGGCCFDKAPDSLHCPLQAVELSSLVESGKLRKTRAGMPSRLKKAFGKPTTCLRWEGKGEAGHSAIPSLSTPLQKSSQGWLIIQVSLLQETTP